MNVETYADNLFVQDGLFFSKNKTEISYPEEGNVHCAQIEDSSFWFKHRNKCIEAVVQKYGQKRVFFDVGGGNGFVAKGIQASGTEAILVEPGINGCLNAQKRKIKTIICSTLEDAGFFPDRLPAVGLFDVVEHIEDDISFLKQIHRYLENEGLIYITVPAYKLLWSADDDYAGHFRRYTLAEMEQKLTSLGFDMLYSTYIFSILPLPIFLMRTLPSKFLKTKSPSDLDKIKDEHGEKSSLLNDLLNKLWQWELRQINAGKKIPFGGSCLLVAKKK
jgi:SAM-dependent methyltransferase